MNSPVEERDELLIIPAGFVAVRDGDGRLLFLFDATRDLIQIKPKGRGPVLIDLRVYRADGKGAQGKVV